MQQLEKQKLTPSIFEKMSEHEQVVFCNDPVTGLQAIIAIHDTTLGPALGGTRMYPYETVDDALEDVLRLSEGMTKKCAAADLDFGGGKAVIIGDPKTDKSPALFRAFAQYVDALNGRFYTGTDMGTTMDDFVHALKETNFINGVPKAYGGSGDSSIPTAKGVVYALEATNDYLYGSNTLGDKSYAIQGLGKVGYKVAEHLMEQGATLYVTDIFDEAIERIVEKGKMHGTKVHVVRSEEIYEVDAHIFVPCAMGSILNETTIASLKVDAVVGSANNQLTTPDMAMKLREKGILYAPDYIVNAGGLIQVSDELYEPNAERVLWKTKAIYDTLLDVYEVATNNGITTEEAANIKCEKTLLEQRHRNNFYSRDRRPKWQVRE